ncbi:MAG: hypothetical protein Q9227_008394 [Pyrenula ochraceoflavens]
MTSPVGQQPDPAPASSPPLPPRHKPLARATTLADVSSAPLKRRRSSFFSDNMSETRRSLRTSVSHDLLIPRAEGTEPFHERQESSHWNSIPLGLALLPAVGGLLFKNGSAVVTDVTLLALAAIFLNWSVRLPWEWYASAQNVLTQEPSPIPPFNDIEEESGEDESKIDTTSLRDSSHNKAGPEPVNNAKAEAQRAARNELNIHEMLALFSCFVSPAVGAWLLHTIRSQLSRPSEGLVSNYNLTVFLLASEIRPVSHLVKMVQARTFHLQRVAAMDSTDADSKAGSQNIVDMLKRLEDLEAHVADSADSKAREASSETLAATTAAQVNSEIRKGLQPELDALNRAVRRYEKRATISGLQTENRLQDLEARLNDTIVLAAAAQRNFEARQNRGVLTSLQDSLTALLAIPGRLSSTLLQLPMATFQWSAGFFQRQSPAKGKLSQARSARQTRESRVRDRRSKLAG